MADWKAQVGRISFFPVITSGAPFPLALEFYKKVWEADPDSFQKQPSSGIALAPSLAQGNHNGLSVSCTVTPARIDFNEYALRLTQETKVNLIEDTGNFRGELERIVRSADKFSIATGRVGCFAQFMSPAESFRDANMNVLSILPKRFKLELSDEEDFILQLNNPRRENGFILNLVTKWSVDRVRILNLEFGTGQTQLLSEHVVSSITFDNNNLPIASLTKEQINVVLNKALQEISTGLRDANLTLEGF